MLIHKTKQTWTIGRTVNVGFLRDLLVMSYIPTPHDSMPDMYLLWRDDKWYTFQPHNGLERVTRDEARRYLAD